MNLILSFLSCVITTFCGIWRNAIAPTTNLTVNQTSPTVNDVMGTADICRTPGCEQAASAILESMDLNVKPCDDFYQFACGNFIKKTNISNDNMKVNRFNIAVHKLWDRFQADFEEESKPNDSKPLGLVKTLYKDCMNESLLEDQGLKPLHRILMELGGWPVLKNYWTPIKNNYWKESRFNGYLISINVGVDLKNSTKHVLTLDQASLGLPWKYLTNGKKDQFVKTYFKYMVDIAGILGANKEQAEEELEESLKFEMQLANISLPSEKRQNAVTLYNPMTVRELQNKFSSIPWLEYINTLLKPSGSITADEVVVVNVPDYIASLEKLLEITPKRVQANYLMWRVVADLVSYLNNEIRERQNAYSNAISGDTMGQDPRKTECMQLVLISFPLGTGAHYVQKYSNKAAKNTAIGVVLDIMQEFKKVLKTTDWMDEETRKAALDKAESMNMYIGYPDELLDDSKVENFYSSLKLTPGNYLQNILNLKRFETEYQFEKLGKLVNENPWLNYGRIAYVNSLNTLTDNSIRLPIGMLQGMFLNPDNPKYMNYGEIGWIISNKIMHGFGAEGSKYDKNGNLVNWWTDNTRNQFVNRSECILRQYGNYTTADLKLKLNTAKTLSEDIADSGGIKVAYHAYMNWMRENKPEPSLPNLQNYSPQQMFWLSAANTYCSKLGPNNLRVRIATDARSPTEFRVIGSLSNTPDFAKDFNCPKGSPMNPEKKCAVW